jgi:hypothetical protein
MNRVNDKTRLVPGCAVSTVLSIALVSASVALVSAQYQMTSGPSYCHHEAEVNRRRYGHLYTWESARRACQLLGKGWRLPTNDEWQEMAKQYGGLREQSEDKGKAAYAALLFGGSSGLNVVLGGGRTPRVSTRRCRLTDCTGRHQKAIQTWHGSTTSVRARCFSTVIPIVRKRGRFPFGVSANGDSNFVPAYGEVEAYRLAVLVAKCRPTQVTCRLATDAENCRRLCP